MDRKAYVERLKTQLDEWNAEIDEMEQLVSGASAELQEEYEKQLKRVYADRDNYQARLDQIMAAGEDAWSDMRHAMEQSWEDLRRGLLKAHSRFKED